MPVYLIALVWIFAVFALRVNTPGAYVGTALASAAAFLLGRLFFPDRMVEVEIPPQPKEADPQGDALRLERDRAMSELQRLGDNIEDEEISERIAHLRQVTGQIFDQLLTDRRKAASASRFLDYYLPTTIKLLNQYDRMDQLGADGENITAAKQRVRSSLDTVSKAFDRQLDALFQDEYMDISAEITVLEQMLRQQGLTGSRLGTDGKA
jgi:hypothetical protein